MLKILPIDDCHYKDGEVYVDNTSITYVQNADTCSSEVQTLKLFTENNGVARFVCLETTRWAIDDIDGLIEILKDFQARAGLASKS
jgi:uncharacterized GH25 family protein